MENVQGHILRKPASVNPSAASAVAPQRIAAGRAPLPEPRVKILSLVVTFLSVPARFMATAPTVFPVGPAAIHGCCGRKPDSRHSVHPECLSSFRRQKTPHVPVKPPLTAAPFLTQEPGTRAIPRSDRTHLMVRTRHRFRRRLRTRHHPLVLERPQHCLALRPHGSRRLLLAALSRTTAFEAPE
jgi:hypothetical protein